MKFRKLFQTAGYGAMTLALMGNQSCEEASTTRKLKMRVGTYGISSQEFTLPGGTKFNLSSPVSAQLEVALNNHPDFYVSSRAPQTELQLMTSNSAPECVRDVPQMMVGGSIPYFEFVTGAKVSFGYSKDGDFGNVNGSATVHVDVSQMALLLKAYNPLTFLYTAMGDATSNQTKTKVSAEVNFRDLSVRPELFLETPLEKVSRTGITKALDKMAKDAAKIEWNAQVKADFESHISIGAGHRAGLMVGDVLTVHNQLYFWENNGEPCKVPLSYQLDQRPGKPTAVIRLHTVQGDVSIGEVIDRPTEENAHVGAIVRIKEFAPKASVAK